MVPEGRKKKACALCFELGFRKLYSRDLSFSSQDANFFARENVSMYGITVSNLTFLSKVLERVISASLRE